MKKKFTIRAILSLLVTVAATMATGTPAHAEDAGIQLDNFRLRPISNRGELQDRVAELNMELPNIGVNSILQQAPHTGTPPRSSVCNSSAVQDSTVPYHFSQSICFDADDNGNSNSEWWPQGVTSVADAVEDQTWGDTSSGWDPTVHQPLLITWYNKDDWIDDGKNVPTDEDQDGLHTERKGVRITFLDASTGRYAHVLLVYPFENDSGNMSYMSVRTTQQYSNSTAQTGSLHAGGVVWYGNYLYVADTSRGFRVFDLRNIIDLGALPLGQWNSTDKEAIGRQNGVYYAHGYRYILPESDGWTRLGCDSYYDPPGTGCDAQDGDVNCTKDDITPRTSYASLDRSSTTRHIVTGEWCDRTKIEDEDSTGRVIRWPMDSGDGTPATTDGEWKADAAYRIPWDPGYVTIQKNGGIQGVAVVDGTYYLNQSLGNSLNGEMIVAKPNTTTKRLETISRQRSAIGIEDFSTWPGSPYKLWTVTEHPGQRMLFSTTP